MSSLQVMELAAAVVSIGTLVLFLNRSTLGIAMRAASRDFSTVRLMGIRANRVIATAFAISGALAGVAAVFILARRGSVAGAALGGMLLGFVEVGLLVALPQELGGLKEVLTYGIVIAILVYRPEGLLGQRRELGDKEF